MSTTTTAFDPTKYLKKLNGKDYLEVVHRLQWLRAEHKDATITTALLHVDFEAGWAIFHARVEIPGQGVAEGTGSETRAAFPAGWLEKAETIAIGRALAALGYGTAFCLDFDTVDDDGNGHLADSPVEPSVGAKTPRTEPAPVESGTSSHESPCEPRRGPTAATSGVGGTITGTGLATPAQLKLIYLSGTRDAHLTEEELEEQCHAQFGRLPVHLTKREASEFIDALKGAKK